MLRPTRPLPKVGSNGVLTHFGGEREDVIVTVVLEGGRRVLVCGESGEEGEFVLSEATAKFVPADGGGASLKLLD